MSIQSIGVSKPYSYNPPKLLTQLPEEILLQTVEKLLPTSFDDSHWAADIENLQCTCQLFFRLGLEVKNTALLNFFKFGNEILKMRLENLKASYEKNYLYIKQIGNFVLFNKLDSGYLSFLMKLGIVEQDVKSIKFSKLQKNYLDSKSAFWSILKEKPDFAYFKQIPDFFLVGNNYQMLCKAFREDTNIFEAMVTGKVSLYYPSGLREEEPFVYALSHPDQIEMVQALYPYVKDDNLYPNGGNAIHIAAATDNVDALIFLQQQGVNCKKKNNDGQSPIFLSVARGYAEFTKKLIEYGEAASVRDKEENTVLMAAAQGCDLLSAAGFFSNLIAWGAEIDAINCYGKNILHILFENEQFQKFINIIGLLDNKAIEDKSLSEIEEWLLDNIEPDEFKLFSKMVLFINEVLSKSYKLAYAKDKNGVSPFDYLSMKFGASNVFIIESINYKKNGYIKITL